MMEAFEIADVLTQQADSGRLYLEFMRSRALSVGVYVLPADAADPQSPHAEDEVYYVVAGRGSITVDGESRALEPGSVVFVGAEVEHRFHDITEDLQLLVFFAPPESS